MGFTNAYTRANYLKVKEGKFWLDGVAQDLPFEGKIVDISYKDLTYEGDTKRMCSFKFIDDQGDVYKLDLNTETNNYSTLISFLANKSIIDLTLPVTLHPRQEPIEGKQFKRNSILVSQLQGTERVNAKAFFTKATPHGLPEWNVVKVGNKTVVDKSDYFAFLEKFVTTELVKRLTPDAPELKPAATGTIVERKTEAKAEAVDTTFPQPEAETVVEKMPWD